MVRGEEAQVASGTLSCQGPTCSAPSPHLATLTFSGTLEGATWMPIPVVLLSFFAQLAHSCTSSISSNVTSSGSPP